MFKRYLLLGAALIIISSIAACGVQTTPSVESRLIISDVILGNDSISDEPAMTPPPDLIQSEQQQTEALAEEKEYLKTEIDALNQKLTELQWLRDSYITENPADLQAKLAECDAKIADINAQLQGLQNRMARNDQDQNTLDGDNSATDLDGTPMETTLESPADSSQPEESVPAS